MSTENEIVMVMETKQYYLDKETFGRACDEASIFVSSGTKWWDSSYFIDVDLLVAMRDFVRERFVSEYPEYANDTIGVFPVVNRDEDGALTFNGCMSVKYSRPETEKEKVKRLNDEAKATAKRLKDQERRQRQREKDRAAEIELLKKLQKKYKNDPLLTE